MMDRKQSVLIVHNYYQVPGGEDTVVANEKKMLEDHGHKVVLYTRNNTELKEMPLWQKVIFPFTLIFSFRTYREVKKQIRKEGIDIVHVHNTLSLVSPSVYYAALSCRVPVVQTVHNFRLLCPAATFYRDGHICEDCLMKGLGCAVKHKCYRQSRIQTLGCVISMLIHRMTGIYGRINYICLTEFNKEKLCSLKQIKPERVFVKPNFTKKQSGSNIENIRKNQIIYLGRIEKIKGISLLLETWKKYGASLPILKVYGNGPMKEACLSEIKNNRIKNIVLNDFIPHEEAMEELSSSIALILPTQVYEGFPMTIVESLSVATPVLCSKVGNAGALIEDDITGYRFDNLPESVISAVRRVTGNAVIREKCLEKYCNSYTEAGNYNALYEIYCKVSL